MSFLVSIKEAEYRNFFWTAREFRLRKDHNCGFTFSCDADGVPNLTNPGAKENFEYCLANPDKIQDLGVVEYAEEYREPAVGRCSCGKDVPLVPYYLDACQCEGCGQWYSVSGYPLLDPDKWGDGKAF